MAKYRSKVVEIDAHQWTGSNIHELKEWADEVLPLEVSRDVFRLVEGKDNNFKLLVWDYLQQEWIPANLYDWIIKGLKDEFYPCDPEVFTAKYEAIE